MKSEQFDAVGTGFASRIGGVARIIEAVEFPVEVKMGAIAESVPRVLN